MAYQDKITQLKKYTPPFIKEGEILEAIYTAVGKAIDTLETEMKNLKDSYWTGKGLELKVEEGKMLTRQSDTEADIRTRLTQKFDINKARGTRNKVEEELLFLVNSNDSNDINFYDKDNCGFIMDVNYVGDKVAFLDVNKLITLNVPATTITTSGGVYGTAVYGTDVYAGETENPNNVVGISNLIKEELIPIDVELLIEEV